MAEQTHFVVFWIRIFTSPLPLPRRETSLTKMLLGRGRDTEPIECLEGASGIPTDDRNNASGGGINNLVVLVEETVSINIIT